MSNPTRIKHVSDWIVIPVHNRRELTLGCLRALAADGVFTWATILVVDDGSNDGTGAAIAQEFPHLDVLRGDGTWWWGGAIRRGMERALTAGALRIFWLNDDCRPPASALGRLREKVEREACVAWIDARAGAWSYGAHRKTCVSVRRCSAEDEARGAIDTFSGNCVCLPRAWIERVGLVDDHSFPHGLGDLDYGLRLRRAGAPLRRLENSEAESSAPPHAATERWLVTNRSLREIWREFSSPRSFLYFPAWRRFSLRHWGPLWGWVVFTLPYTRWMLIALLRAVAPGAARAWARRRDVTSPSDRDPSRG